MLCQETLTHREVEIIQQIANGHTDHEIAGLLSISNSTVSTHRKKILRKLKIKNTAMLVMYAVKKRIIS